MHPGGFEPPTARFVAEYSIQLSYGCIGKFILLLILIPLLKPYQVRDGASGRIRTSDRSVRSRVLYPAELRMHRETYFTADFLIPLLKPYQVRDGASGIRALRAVAKATLPVPVITATSSIPSSNMVHPGGFEPPTVLSSYPAELRMQMAVRRGFEPRMQLLTAYSLSRGAPSASRPPHHTPLTSASKNLFIAHRRCVAHILLSETYKSNNFSYTFIVCTLHVQLVCKNVKKSVLSTEEWRSDR